nr:hypothetical protein [uncultured Chryseobacterium sp.]
MRISNRRKVPVYHFFSIVLLIMILVGIGAFLLEEYKFNILGVESYLLLVFPLVLLIFFFLHGRQIFEYDSDGEAIHFRNRSIIPMMAKPVSDEFPKYKLVKYELVTILFVKRLYITVTSKNGGSTMLKYEISYLNKKQVKDLKNSLSKVIKTNKERIH